MNQYKTGGGEIVYSDSDDDEPNEAAFVGVDLTFKNLVRKIKMQLYEITIKGVPITSNKAQDNTLLITYFTQLNRLDEMCDTLHTRTHPDKEIDQKLSMLPVQSHYAIRQLLDWLKKFYSNNKEVDAIPYDDYLDVQLKRYPCIQKII